MAEKQKNANQYLCDPRQKLCWDLYVNPKSETFGNGFQSGIKAGYEKNTAKQITRSDWFIEKIRRLNMLSKAEKVLDDCLEMDTADAPHLLKIKQDTAKFVAERLGKKEGYTTRSELTGADGKDIMPDNIKIAQSNDALKQYLNGINGNTTGK